ncbi:hypothetical protein DFP72DRAFT_847310 [Ephemerocybe angulata]|uniref:Uncharacterized protein n=1 Tax=Ephemerocybe angulata TaxID=980116 RepID=A0A8H6HYI5_9AGAR|nr:hypothetical protein DFP72DRAFT_847310 [Tulosesus angulatus]
MPADVLALYQNNSLHAQIVHLYLDYAIYFVGQSRQRHTSIYNHGIIDIRPRAFSIVGVWDNSSGTCPAFKGIIHQAVSAALQTSRVIWWPEIEHPYSPSLCIRAAKAHQAIVEAPSHINNSAIALTMLAVYFPPNFLPSCGFPPSLQYSPSPFSCLRMRMRTAMMSYIWHIFTHPSLHFAPPWTYVRQNEVYAREPHNLDTSSHKFTARDLLSELSTRELVDELKRRKYTPYYPKAPPRPLSYPCKACGSNLHSASQAEDTAGADKLHQLTLHKKDKHDEGTCDKCGVYHSKNPVLSPRLTFTTRGTVPDYHDNLRATTGSPRFHSHNYTWWDFEGGQPFLEQSSIDDQWISGALACFATGLDSSNKAPSTSFPIRGAAEPTNSNAHTYK